MPLSFTVKRCHIYSLMSTTLSTVSRQMGLSYKVVSCTGATISKEKLKAILGVKRWNENVIHERIEHYNATHESKIHRLCKETGDLYDEQHEAKVVFGYDGISNVKEVEDYLLRGLTLRDIDFETDVHFGICIDCCT